MSCGPVHVGGLRAITALVFGGALLATVIVVRADGAASEAAPAAVRTGEPFATDRAKAGAKSANVRGQIGAESVPPRSPAATIASFKLLPGFEAKAVLHEPDVRQPVQMSFDERGRLWVVEYVQFPYPAGLKIVDIGNQFHVTFDKVPPPPPHNDRGADRISIHEDTDHDGVYDSNKVFVDGLNIVTAAAKGRGGVWVLNPPYLLFYPDADNDDVPDGPPTVHLAGFGIQDTHACANSLTWGPDGWLWGAQGSSVTSKIFRPGIDRDGDGFAFQGQAIWRYNPGTRAFELFAEGGGNTFSLIIDSKGQVFSGTNAGETRGNHYLQGAYHAKNWGEHGYLTNPYAFGYFGSMEHNWKSPHFTHTLAFYEDGLMGPEVEGHFVAPNALLNRVELTERIAQGSTYRTRDVATFLESDDRWFRPVDIKVGPDGAIYLADWYDIRLAHADPRDTWDHDRGRVYRIARTGATATPSFDLGTKSSEELVGYLSHRQSWFRNTALRLLADRRDRSVAPELTRLARDPANPHALDALWGLHAVGGFSLTEADPFICHPQADVRRIAVRLIGDRAGAGDGAQTIPTPLANALEQMARTEPDVQVRGQLASTARRLPAGAALPVIFALMDRAEDADDPRIPLMIWWALERFAESDRAAILDAFTQPAHWKSALVRKYILARLAQRYACVPSTPNQQALARLAKLAPPADLPLLRQGIEAAFEGRGIAKLTPEMEAAFFSGDVRDFSDPLQLSLGVRRGDQNAILAAMALILREEPKLQADRVKVLDALADAKAQSALPVLLEVLGRTRSRPIQEAALSAVGRLDDPQLVKSLLPMWPKFDPILRERALLLLVSRASWARELLTLVHQAEVIPKSDITATVLRSARLLGDPEVDAIADRYYGAPPAAATSEENRRPINAITHTLASSPPGNAAAGAKGFAQRCAVCHTLFGQGETIGPELTGLERTNVPTMLLNIVDPSASIREGYTLFQFRTKDKRTLVGFVDQRDTARVVIRDSAGQRTPLATSDVVKERALPTSLMPEGLLDGLSDQELKDFFAYLSSPAPATNGPSE
jgi:putative membrane-bound dehydrogenase-like protein